MPWGSGNLEDNPQFRVLQVAVQQIRTRLGITDRAAAAATTAASGADKRFRIAVKTVGLSLLTPVSVDMVWSTPLPSATYKVDVNCSALVGMPVVTIANQSAAGCTVTFTPSVIATNAVVIALAIAPVAG